MLKKANVDITGGPLFKSIVIYALPVMLGNLIQVLFNAADLVVIGNMGDKEGLDIAGVGATAVIINLFVNSCVGLSAGVSAVLARCLGERENKRARAVVDTSIISSVVLGVVLAVLLAVFCDPFLRITNCPEECFDRAGDYIRVYSLGVPFVLLYNFAAAIVRTSGDTRTPFVYLVIGGVLNVALNFVLCLVLEAKVVAVAIATTASQAISAILTLIHLFRMNGECGMRLGKLAFSLGELWKILKIGAPCAFNSALFALSNLQMQATINSFGADAISGNSAASSIEGIVVSLTNGFTSAVVPFVGQNIGAEKRERVGKSVFICASVVTSIALSGSLLVYALARPVLGLYIPENPAAIDFGIMRVRYVFLFFSICTLYNIFVGAMQAFGYSFIPTVNSIITVLVFRVIWLEGIYPSLDAANRSIANLYICYPISWILTLTAHTVMFLIIYTRYKKGKVRTI